MCETSHYGGYPFLSFMGLVVLKDGVEKQQERNVICA